MRIKEVLSTLGRKLKGESDNKVVKRYTPHASAFVVPIEEDYNIEKMLEQKFKVVILEARDSSVWRRILDEVSVGNIVLVKFDSVFEKASKETRVKILEGLAHIKNTNRVHVILVDRMKSRALIIPEEYFDVVKE